MNEYTEETIIKDEIESFGYGTTIQHGKLNDRIYLIKLDEKDLNNILEYIHKLAIDNSYTKIFCKVPGYAAPFFIANGLMKMYFLSQNF